MIRNNKFNSKKIWLMIFIVIGVLSFFFAFQTSRSSSADISFGHGGEYIHVDKDVEYTSVFMEFNSFNLTGSFESFENVLTIKNAYGRFYSFLYISVSVEKNGHFFFYFVDADYWDSFILAGSTSGNGSWANPTLFHGYYCEAEISSSDWRFNAEDLTVRCHSDFFDVSISSFLSDCTIVSHYDYLFYYFNFYQYEKLTYTLHYLVAMGDDIPFALLKTSSKELSIPDSCSIDWAESQFDVDLDVLVSSPKTILSSPSGDGCIDLYVEYSTIDFYTFEADGTRTFVQLTLSPFSLMKKTDGSYFSLTDLNQSGKDFFSVGDYLRSEVYGYFYRAVFNTSIGDLNLYFKNTEIHNAQVYFSHGHLGLSVREYIDNPEKILIGGVLTAFCPIFGFGYFVANTVEWVDIFCLYVDVFGDPAFIALNGAENINDTQGAVSKAWDSFIDDLGSSDFVKFFKILFGVSMAILLVVVIIRVVQWFKDKSKHWSSASSLKSEKKQKKKRKK